MGSPGITHPLAPVAALVLLALSGSGTAFASGFEPWLITDPLHAQVLSPKADAPSAEEIGRAEADLNLCLLVLGDQHPGTRLAEVQLGEILLRSGAPDRAEAVLRRALGKIASPHATVEPVERVRIYTALSEALSQRGRVREAITVGEQALTLARQVQPAPDLSLLVLRLATIHLSQGSAREAWQLLAPLEESEAWPGAPAQGAPSSTHRDALRRRAALAEAASFAQWEMGEWQLAEASERRVAARLEQLGGAAIDVSAVLNNLAVMMSHLEREGEVESLLGRAAQLRARALGERHPRTGLILRNQGALAWRSGNLARAESLLGAAHLAYREGLGAQHPDSLMLLVWLGALHRQAQGGWARAEDELGKVVQSGESEELVHLAREQLAWLHLDKGLLAEAAQMAGGVLAERQRRLAADDPALLWSSHLLATIELRRGRRDAALRLLGGALSALARVTSAHSTLRRAASPIELLLMSQLGATYLSALDLAHLPAALLAGPALALDAPAVRAETTCTPSSEVASGMRVLGQALSSLSDHLLRLPPEAQGLRALRTSISQAQRVIVGTLLASMLDRARCAQAPAIPEDLARAILRSSHAEILSGELAALVERLRQDGTTAQKELLAQRSALLRSYFQLLHLPSLGSHQALPHRPTQRLAEIVSQIEQVEQRIAQKSSAFRRLLSHRDLDVGQLTRLLGQRQGSLLVLLRAYGPSPPAPVPIAAPEPVWYRALQLKRDGASLPPLRGSGGTSAAASGTPQTEKQLAPVDQYAALVISPFGPPLLVPLGEAAPIDSAADSLAGLAQGLRDVQPALQQLGAQLLTPLSSHIPTGRRLYVLPAQELFSTPFSALPFPDGQLLCQRGAVATITNVFDLYGRERTTLQPQIAASAPEMMPRSREPASGQGSADGAAHGEPATRSALSPLLLLGAPHLREPLTYLGPRAAAPVLTPQELTHVGHILRLHRYDPRGGPISGLAATRTRLLAWLPSSVVHILAPFIFLPDARENGERELAHRKLAHRPFTLPFTQISAGGGAPAQTPALTAGIALAAFSWPADDGGRGRSDDGFLSADDLAGFDLRRTDLLVLSGPVAPSTARMTGPGRLRLHTAAARTGAGSLLMTLWRPGEAASRQLMTEFYQAWLRHRDTPQAVREVQLVMHQRGVPPLTWAGLLTSSF